MHSRTERRIIKGTPKAKRARENLQKNRASKHQVKRNGHPATHSTAENHVIDRARLRVLDLRKKLHTGEISQREFRELLKREERENIFAARVQLRSVARDLIGEAAKQSRKGRSRLLAVIGNILLAGERVDMQTDTKTEPTNITLLHAVPRPAYEQKEITRAAPEHARFLTPAQREEALGAEKPPEDEKVEEGVVPPQPH